MAGDVEVGGFKTVGRKFLERWLRRSEVADVLGRKIRRFLYYF